MEELHNLNASKLGGNFMAKPATTLVDTEALLDQNGIGDYLRHSREIAHIQDMLPKAEKLKDIKMEKNYIGSEFVKLKAFLVERKWEEDQLRKFGTRECSDDTKKVQKICNYCSIKRHMKSECFKFKRERGGEDKGAGASAGKEDECWTGLKRGIRSTSVLGVGRQG